MLSGTINLVEGKEELSVLADLKLAQYGRSYGSLIFQQKLKYLLGERYMVIYRVWEYWLIDILQQQAVAQFA
jgi:hypothetical protein